MPVKKEGPKNVYEALANIQAELNAPKGQWNKHGNFSYRSAENIMEAVKPIAKKYGSVITLDDRVIRDNTEHGPELLYTDDRKKGGRVKYDLMESTAEIILIADGGSVSVSSVVGVDQNKTGMHISQSYGASSSYARKAALGGLLMIDDNKDPDSKAPDTAGATRKETPMEKKAAAKKPPAKKAPTEKEPESTKPVLSAKDPAKMNKAVEWMQKDESRTMHDLKALYEIDSATEKALNELLK